MVPVTVVRLHEGKRAGFTWWVDDLAPQCARGLLEALRRLDQGTLAAVTRDLLSAGQVKGLLARRDFMVKYYEERIRELGEAAVLYELSSRVHEAAAVR